MFLKRLLRLFGRKSEEEQEGQQKPKAGTPPKEDIVASQPEETTQQIVNVSDTLRMTVKGLPSNLDEAQTEAILLNLLRLTLAQLPERPYAEGQRIHHGKAQLNIRGQLYEIGYELDAIRAVAALNTFKQAFDTVNAGAAAGIYDKDLAQQTAQYFKESAWQELMAIRKRWVSISPNTRVLQLEFPKEVGR